MASPRESGRGTRLATRVGIAALVAALVGFAVALLSSRLIEFRVLGPWGAVYGTLAFIAAFGVALAGLGGSAQKRLGSVVVAVATGLLSGGAWLWIAGWRVPPFTVEGAWLWPLALCSGIVAVVAVVRAIRPRS